MSPKVNLSDAACPRALRPPAEWRGGLLKEAHRNAPAVQAYDFTMPFGLALIDGKRAGHDNIAPDIETAPDLDIGATGAEILDDPFEKLTIGSKMCFYGAGRAGVPAGIAGFFDSAPASWRYSFYHGITIYFGTRSTRQDGGRGNQELCAVSKEGFGTSG